MLRSNSKYFIYQDLIGVSLDAKHKFNPSWDTFRPIGLVEDETRNTLVIQTESGHKIFLKDQYHFRVWLCQPNGSSKLLQFDGQKIIGRPETRIKQIRKIRRKLH